MVSYENSEPPIGPPAPRSRALVNFFSELTTISVTGHSIFSLAIVRPSYLQCCNSPSTNTRVPF